MIIITASKGIKSRFLRSPHCAASCLQHVRSNGQGAIVCRSLATHRALITCNMSVSHVVPRDSSTSTFVRHIIHRQTSHQATTVWHYPTNNQTRHPAKQPVIKLPTVWHYPTNNQTRHPAKQPVIKLPTVWHYPTNNQTRHPAKQPVIKLPTV